MQISKHWSIRYGALKRLGKISSRRIEEKKTVVGGEAHLVQEGEPQTRKGQGGDSKLKGHRPTHKKEKSPTEREKHHKNH